MVEHTKQFVMIRIDKDKHPDVSSKYAPDGQYIPRTYFLSPAGTLDPSIHEALDRYMYFYKEDKPDSLLAGMNQGTAEAALKVFMVGVLLYDFALSWPA